jgi:Tol biopolymer transport system component/tRNA A-37 threonylcarbamoyl transferase component Bud32
MGELYKARDTRLDRTVAIKILPADLAADPEFRERFDREARSISALSHPNICTLYDVGEVPSADSHAGRATTPERYLVLEYLDGETLAARLAHGPLPLPDAFRAGLEILSALEAAHRRGIVHRDLKPGNVMLTKTGAKLLDFGLAKSGSPLSPVSSSASMLPTTMERPLTARGTILGTFQYMAPEQIEGDVVDARTDLFAFGALLYEMVTGRRAFSGKTQASLVGAILKEDPPPVSQTQTLAPPALDYLVRTCLAKDPDARYQTAHDVWLQLKWIAEGGSAAAVPAPVVPRRRTRERIAWTVAVGLGGIAVAAGVLALTHLRERPPAADRIEFPVTAEDASVLSGGMAVSPSGREVAFSTFSAAAGRRLWMRSLGSQTTRPVRGGEGGVQPFWSPNGRSLGFLAGGKLRTMDSNGGPSVPLCDVAVPSGGATWGRGDVIVFSPSTNSALMKVNASGGACTPLTTLGKEEVAHLQPVFLPDGRHVLYLAVGGASRQLYVTSLDSTGSTFLGPAESAAIYGSGYLLFARSGALVAQPFDLSNLRLTGEPVIVSPLVSVPGSGRLLADVSPSGVLAYSRGLQFQTSRLTWMDRSGATIGIVGEPGVYSNLNLSPDERRVAVSLTTGSPLNRDIWIIDLARAATATRRSFDPAVEADPTWSPDGTEIVYNSNRDRALYNTGFRLKADGGSTEAPIVKLERLVDSPEWSHDGRSIVFTGGQAGSSNDLWILSLTGEGKPRPLVETPFAEDSPAFSPDDRWIAYNANPSDRFEVFVRPAASGGGEVQISRDGGWGPRWRNDGKELFFLGLDGKMMAVPVAVTAAGIEPGVPRALFPTPLRRGNDRRTFAVTRDGKRFLLIVPETGQPTIPVTVVVNWLTGIQR